MEDKKEKEYVIYKITCNTDESLIYIGSTTNFKCRKSQHKNCCINSNLKNYHLKLYKNIRENGGWSNWKMQPIEIYNTDNKTKARIRENQLMESFKSNLNCISACMVEDIKIYKQRHYQDNKTKYNEKTKEYYKLNKEDIKTYKQKYYEN